MVPFEWQFLTHSGLSRASNVQGDFSCFGAKIGDFCGWRVVLFCFLVGLSLPSASVGKSSKSAPPSFEVIFLIRVCHFPESGAGGIVIDCPYAKERSIFFS